MERHVFEHGALGDPIPPVRRMVSHPLRRNEHIAFGVVRQATQQLSRSVVKARMQN